MYKKDKTLSIFIPLMRPSSFRPKTLKFREFTVFHIFFTRKNFRESAFAEFFAEITFANSPKIRENRESFFPRKFLPLKYCKRVKSYIDTAKESKRKGNRAAWKREKIIVSFVSKS